MRVREADKYGLQTFLGKILTQVAHGIGSHHTDMIVVLWLLGSHPSDLLGHKVNQLISNLHPQDKFIREDRSQPKEQSAVSTPNINHGDSFSFQTVAARLLVEGRVLDRVAVSFEIALGRASEVQRIVGFPIDVGVVGRVWEGSGVERIDVCSHSVIFLLGEQPFFFGEFAWSLVLVGLLVLDFLSLHKRNIIVETSSGYGWQI